MKVKILILFLLPGLVGISQPQVSMKDFNPKNRAVVNVKGDKISVTWPVSKTEKGRILINLKKESALFDSIEMTKAGSWKEITSRLDPSFILTVGKRDLISQNGWNIFFDKVPEKPHQSYLVQFDKTNATVSSAGSHTIIKLPGIKVEHFSGSLEITFYNGSPLFNVAAVMSTPIDSVAMVYDAGLISKFAPWKNVAWTDTANHVQHAAYTQNDTSKNIAVKYRTMIGENDNGSLAIFPSPHQYFYPLDEAFNLKFLWYGNNYRNLMPGSGIGIRQDLQGDRRYVPWFNAPPGTLQRLDFYCLLGTEKADNLMAKVKQFTHNDKYLPLNGYKTMSSHFHNEFIMKVVLANLPVPEKPEFVDVFKSTGVDIVHLAEFHYTAHPKGPDDQRLLELKTLFQQCKRLSSGDFLLLPGEEPNEFFGGHWLEFFPRPVYWIMSRKPGQPFVTDDPQYGKVYRIGDKNEMLQLLDQEQGLAWTAHARTKGSTGFPDKYKDEAFFASDRFMGAAWKAIPADLSQPRLGKRIFDLMDDMNNWGLKKHVIAEADIFTITHANEMYAHLNVNYLQLDRLPAFDDGWKTVLDAMQKGRFFSTTGEVLVPTFTVNGKSSGETVQALKTEKSDIAFSVKWTYPLNFAEIVSGDGKQVYRERINLNMTEAFGEKTFHLPIDLKNRTWLRLEIWDVAANGAFTQSVWVK